MGFNDFFEKTQASTISTLDIRKELEQREGNTIFPLEIFHKNVKPFINELHTKYDIPRSYIGLSILLAYSTAIGTAYAVSRNGTDQMYLSLWGCMNGISSSGKSYALDMCLKPLNQLQDEIDNEWKQNTEKMSDTHREQTSMKTLIYRDAHIPTLIRWVMPANPKGVLKESDEILEWINGLNALSKKESTDEQFWLSAWNGRKYSAIRSSNQKFVIPRVFTNIIGGIQPKLLYKLFKNERGDSGFIFRVLFASPENYKIAQPIHGYAIPEEFTEIYNDHVTRMYNLLPVDDGYEKPKICLMSVEATRLIIQWESQKINTINAIKDVNDMNIHSGVLGKIKEYAYRFAGILAVSDMFFNVHPTQQFFPNTISINEDTMRRALLAADYFYSTALSIYEAVDNSVTAPYEILYMATLFKLNKSLSQMAELILKDKNKKMAMSRMLKKAIKDYPKVFNAVNN